MTINTTVSSQLRLCALFLLTISMTAMGSVGSDWLADQAQSNGVIQSQPALSYPYASTAESLKTFMFLGESDRPLIINGRNYLAAVNNSENAIKAQLLSSQAITGLYQVPLLEQMEMLANEDGGFGALKNYESNVFNTVLALDALYYSGSMNVDVIENAINYLMAQQHADGGFAFEGDNNSDVALSALTSTVLQLYRNNYPVSTAINNAKDYLLAERAGGIAWQDNWKTALALIALAGSESDREQYQAAITELQSQQLANGSWDDDSYTTALALRALAIFDGSIIGPITGDSSIFGQVVDSITNLPIGNARIALSGDNPRSVLSNDQGFFNMNSIELGSYDVTVQKSGYQARLYNIDLQSAQALDLGELPLLRQPDQGILAGVATDATNGALLANVEITISTVPETTVFTTIDGTYEVALPPQELTITASKTGYSDSVATGRVIAGQTLQFSPALIPEGGTIDTLGQIQGLVVDASSGNHLADVTVQIVNGAVTQTSGNGEFLFADLTPGTYDLILSKVDYQSINMSLIVQAGINDLGTIAMPLFQPLTSSIISGTVVDDETLTPIVNANVSVPALGLSTLTDAQGFYQIAGVDQLNVSLSFVANGYQSQVQSLQIQNHGVLNFDIQMQTLNGGDISLIDIRTPETSYEPFKDVPVLFTLDNANDLDVDVRLFIKVLNDQGQIIEEYPKVLLGLGSTIADALEKVPANDQLETQVKWATRQSAPGWYDIIVEVFDDSGTTLLTQGTTPVEILATRKIGGYASFDPPITTFNAREPVKIQAELANRGNLPIDAGNVTAQVSLLNQGFQRIEPEVIWEDFHDGNIYSSSSKLDYDDQNNVYLISRDTILKRHIDSDVATVFYQSPRTASTITDIDRAADGTFWLTNTTTRTLIHLSADGNVIEEITTSVSGMSSVEALSDKVLFSSSASVFEYLFDGTINDINSITVNGIGNSVITDQGTMYVCAYSDNAIYRFKDNKLSLWKDDINTPSDIVLDNNGDLLVSQFSENNVLKIDEQGNQSIYIDQISSPETMSWDVASATLLVHSKSDQSTYRFDSSGSRTTVIPRSFISATAITVDATGRKIISDSSGNLLSLSADNLERDYFNAPIAGNDMLLDGNDLIVAERLGIRKVNADLSGVAVTLSDIRNVTSIDYAVDGDGYFLAQGTSGGISQLRSDGQLEEKMPLLLGRIKQGVVDSQGNQIIIDSQPFTKVIKMTPTGQFEVLYSSPATLESIAINSQDEIFLSNRVSKTIIKIDSNGVQTDFSTSSIAPAYLVVDDQDTLIFSEFLQSKIYQLDTQGTPVELYDAGSTIRGMRIDALGNIWVLASSRKIVKINATGVVTDFNLTQNVFTLLPDNNGGVYFGSSGFVGLLDATGTVSPFFDDVIFSSESISGIHFDQDDSLWLYTSLGKIYKFDPQNNLVIESAGLESTKDIAVDGSGAVYVVDSRRILKYNGFNQLPEILVTGFFQKIFVTQSGDAYYSSRNAIYLYQPADGTSNMIASGYRGLGHFFVDDSQNRLHAVDTTALSYHLVDVQTGDELDQFFGHDDTIRAMQTLPNGELLVSSSRPNLVMKVRDDGMLATFLSGGTIRDMAVLNNELVLISSNQVFYYSLVDGSLRTTVSLHPQSVESFSIYNGDVYTFSRTGITHIDNQGQLNILVSFDQSITDIESHPDGRVLMSSRIAGSIFRLNDDLSTTLEYSNLPNIAGLSINQSGQIAAVSNNNSIKILDNNEENIIALAPSLSQVIQLVFVDNQLVTVVNNSASRQIELRKITIEEPNDDIEIGDVIYSFQTQFPVLPTLNSTVAIDFGEFLPPVSGDYQLTFDIDGVDNSLVNSLHVGDASFATLSLDSTEVLPGDRGAVLNVNIVGADNTSITQIDASSTSLQVESRTTGRAIAADSQGNIYSANRSGIIKIDVDGNTSEFVTGVTPGNGMAVDSSENIYFGSNTKLLRVDQAGNVTEVTNTTRTINAVVIDDEDVVYFGNSNGLHKVNADGSNELFSNLVTMSISAISIDVLGQFHILDGLNNIYRLSKDGTSLVHNINGAADGLRFEYEGVNLITDCSDNILFAPFSFTPFDYSGEESIIVQKTTATGAFSQVLYGPNVDAALNDMDVLYYDKINSQILIWTDRNNGKIFAFPVVCGGIDVEFHLTPLDNVDVSGFSQSADRVETAADGTVDYIWTLEDVGSGGIDFSINLDFLGLQEAEVRDALASAHLEFSNTFKPGENIIVPVDIPSISARSQKTLDLSLDQTEYFANSPVEMNFEVFNGLDDDFDGYISITIEDAQGYLVDRLPHLPVISADALSATTLVQLWDTGLSFDGAYQVKAELYDDQDVYLDEASAAFAVINDQGVLSVETRIFADQATYLTNDNVDLVGMVKNLSINAVHPNSTGQIIVNDPNGIEVLNTNMSIGEIITGANRQLSQALALVAATPGVYTVTFNNTDNNATIYHSSSTTFEVIEILADDLSGSVEVSFNPVYVNETTVCSDTINNIAGEALTGVTLRQLLISLPDATIIDEASQNIDLAIDEVLTLSRTVGANGLIAGNYACVLEAQKDDNTIVLGLEQFRVLAFNNIHGVVWHDSDADQIIDIFEPFLSLNVNLLDAQGNMIDTVLSNSDGTYQFNNVRDGDYQVEVESNGAVLTTVSPVLINLSQNDATADFGVLWNQGVISGVIWNDENANGIFDAQESPLANVSLISLKLQDSSLLTVVTGSGGEFSFTDLLIGDYEVRVTDENNVLSGGVLTTANMPLNINIDVFDSYNNANFGYQYNNAQIQNLIFNDANGNGQMDNNESAVSGVSVDLLLADQVIASQSSDPTGVVNFDGLASGHYQIVVTDNAGILNGALLTTANVPFDVILNTGEANSNGIFGYQFANASIVNVIFNDTNGNGVQDIDETGIADVTVALSTNGVVESTLITDTAGVVNFDDLVAGDYQVVVTDTNAVLSDATLTTANVPYAVTLNSGDNDTSGIFGYQFANASITNVIFNDSNGDGIQDTGETGLGNVTVVLSTAGVVESTLTTDANGQVIFDNLVAGDFEVSITDTNGVLTDATLTTANVPYQITLGDGTTDTAGIFGYQFDATADASISGVIFNDLNANGIQDSGELGLFGVSVDLLVSGSVIDSQLTSEDGIYSFVDLSGGDYNIVVSDTSLLLVNATLTTGNQPLHVTLNQGQNFEGGFIGYVIESQSCTFGFGRAADINALVFENYTAQSSDVEGRLAAGGDISINHYSVGDKLNTAISDVLIAGGDINFPSGRVYYGNIIAGGSTAGIGAPVINGMEPGSSISEFSSLPIDFTVLQQDFEQLSLSIAQLPANTTFEYQYGGLNLHGDCQSDLQVFDLDGQQVLNAHTFAVDCIPDGAKVMFNISGAHTGLTNMSMSSLQNFNENVIYNFYQAHTLTLSGIGVEGSILAPYADINNPQGVIHGQLVAKSWNGQMQINHEPYACASSDKGRIHAFIYEDINANAQKDLNEQGIGMVSVDLISNGTIIDTAVSSNDGLVTFDVLLSGAYTLQVTDTSQVLDYAVLTTANDPYLVNLNSNEINTKAVFGYQYLPSGNASISGMVFNDRNNDGINNQGEEGYGGVSIDIMQGSVVLSGQITDANGFYDFTHLPAGDYHIIVTDVADVLITASLTTGNQPLTVSVLDNQDYTDGLFGYHTPLNSCNFDLGPASVYNALVFGHYNAQNSDVEGRLAVGGDININNYSVGAKLDAGTITDVLVAGGHINFPNGRVNYGNIIAGGSTAGIGASVVNGMQSGSVISDFAQVPIDFAAAELHSQNLSQSIAQLPVNTTFEYQYGGLYLHGDCTSDLQVFALDGQQVLNAHTFAVDCIPDGAKVMFNISGVNTGLTNMSMSSLQGFNENVIYNFYQAQNLTLSGIGVEGSILAPYANINNPQGVIHGQLVAKSWNGPMQINHQPYACGQNINVANGDMLIINPIAQASTGINTTDNIQDTIPSVLWALVSNFMKSMGLGALKTTLLMTSFFDIAINNMEAK